MGFVQEARSRTAEWNVCENSQNASADVEPNEINWELHIRHPDRMSCGRIPLQQQAVDVHAVAIGEAAFAVRLR